LTTFVEQHEQLKRIEFEADDYRATKITEGDEFPVLFVAPIGVDMGNAMNMHRIRIYVYERINDDRSDVWENANDTSLMLRDIRVYWNSYSDSDIQILGDPSGEFKCGDELDNLVGYYADFVFEIPSHGRCDVPINVVPDPSPTCAPANYLVQYVDGTLIESGTIPSGGSVTVNVPNAVICQDANYTLTDSDGNVLESGTIASGGSATIVAPDSTFSINSTLVATIPSGSSDSIQVRKQSGSNQIGSLQGQHWRIPNSVITLQDTSNNTLSTTNVPATETATITAPDATVNNSDSTYTLSVPSGSTETIPDSQINVNGVDAGDVVSVKTIDVNITDGTDPVTPDSVSLVGNTLTVEVPSGGVAMAGRELLKTGQKNTYRTGDDGDLQEGRDVDEFILDYINPFGHSQRFTGTTGGYYDQSLLGYYDKDGVATTRLLAFPDEILIDWTTYNNVSGKTLGYAMGSFISNTLANVLSTYASATYGGFSNWRLSNLREYINLAIWQDGKGNTYDYLPLNDSSLNLASLYFTNNARFSTTIYQIGLAMISVTTVAPTFVRGGLACRTFTVTGTTLT
jgi:hypothetical protein